MDQGGCHVIISYCSITQLKIICELSTEDWTDQSVEHCRLDRPGCRALWIGQTRVSSTVDWTDQGVEHCGLDRRGCRGLRIGQTRVSRTADWTEQGVEDCGLDRLGCRGTWIGQTRVSRTADWTDQGVEHNKYFISWDYNSLMSGKNGQIIIRIYFSFFRSRTS